MNEHDDLDAPDAPGENMGFVSRGRARPVGEPAAGGFALGLGRAENPVVRDAFRTDIALEQRQAERDAREAERMASAASKAERNSRLAETEADFRSRGVKFFTDAEGNLRPMTDEKGRTLFEPTPWKKGGDGKGALWQERRDEFGRTVRRAPKIKAGQDPKDPNLYYDFGDEGEEVAGHVDDFAGSKDKDVAAVVAGVQAKRRADLRAASLAPLAKARDDAGLEVKRKEREALQLGEQAAGISARIAEIEADPEFGKTAGGFLGVGASPTEAAGRLAKEREKLAGELDRLQSEQAAASALVGKDGELVQRAKAAQLEHDIWAGETEAKAYDDLAEARRAALKRDGKPEAGDPVLASIAKRQEEIGATRSRAWIERERMRGLAAEAEAAALADKAPVRGDAVRAEAEKLEADLKAFDKDARAGRFDPARRDDLVTRQGTIRGQVARLNAEAVQGQKDFEAFVGGLVEDKRAYKENSERWEWGAGTVSGAFGRQAERFGKVQDAAGGKGRWVEGFGDTLSFVGGAIGTWTDILTGVSPEGVERKQRAETAWELTGHFEGRDAERALTARVAAEEVIKNDPSAQLVAVPSLKDTPFTSGERARMATGVYDLPTLQRLVNGLRESEGGAGDQVGIAIRDASKTFVSLVNVLPGVSLEKMGAPTTPEEFAKWKVLQGEAAKLMAEKFGGAEIAGAVAGSLGQFMLTRKAAGAATAKLAQATVGTRLAAVAANAERNANWLTYSTVGTAQSFTENPESLGFFNRFVSAGMNTLGLATGEIVGNKLEAVVGKLAKVKPGMGNLAARELAGATGATAGEFSSDWLESAVLNQDFTPQVPAAFWGNLGAVLGMRLFGAVGRVKAQRDYGRFAETAAAAKNEAFNRWADVKAFMATPEGKRVSELLPSELVEGGEALAARAFDSRPLGAASDMANAAKALTQDFGLTVGFGQFTQGVQARLSRSRVALGEIDALPDFESVDPTTGAPVVDAATRGANRDAARALVRVANGVPVADLTEAETQGVQLVGGQIGSEVFRDVSGLPVITDKAASWLRDRAPAAASLIGASEADMLARAKTPQAAAEAVVAAEKEATQAPAPDAAPAPAGAAVEFTDAKGAAQSVEVPSGAVVPSTGEAVRDQRTAARWLAETSKGAVRDVRFVGGAVAPASEAPAPAAAPVSAGPGVLAAGHVKDILARAVAMRGGRADKPALAKRVLAARKGLVAAAERWGGVFPGGVAVQAKGAGSGGVFYDPASGRLVVSLEDMAAQLESLADNPARIDALVTEEAIHRAAVEVERAGAWSARELWGALAPVTQNAVRAAYDPDNRLKPSDWQLGHELVRMIVQGRLNVGPDGALVLDSRTVSEATASPGFLTRLRDALAKIADYLRDLGGSLRADGNAPETVAAVENAVALVEARVNELSGGRASPTQTPGQSRPATQTDEQVQEENRQEGRQEGLLTQPAPDLPAAEDTLGGAQAGEIGPRVRVEVGEDGLLSPGSAAALARELGVPVERLGLVEPVTAEGVTFWTVNAAWEADQANTSHTPDGRVNPGYPQALQPRDRSGGQYLAQQRGIASRPNLREEALTGTADHGTPIMALVEGRAVTVMGNGRANAKALMYADADFAQAAAAFERGVRVVAKRKGIEPAVLAGMERPVLVRVMLTPTTPEALRDLSQGSNRPAGAATNAIEQGRIDAGRVTPATLALFKPAFRIDSRENADFRAAFTREVLTRGETNITESDLVRRIENAVFLRAYGGTAEGAAAFERLTGETSDAGVRNLVDAMLELAPEVSVARAKMDAGRLHPLDLSRNIAAAVQRIGVALRDKPRNQTVDTALDTLVTQGSLLGEDGVADEVLAFFVANRRDKARLLQGVRDFYALAYAAGGPDQGELFPGEVPTVAQVWRDATSALLSAPDEIARELRERMLAGRVPTRYDNEEYPYLGDPAADWRASSHPEAGIVNPIDPALDVDAKVDALRALTQQNVPLVERILADLGQIGLDGKYSEKLPERIQAKASRPSIRAEKPWHSVEHVRDGLRFKVGLTHFNKVPQIVRVLQRHGVEVIKFDHKKMFGPKPFGWRFVAWDIRMPNGQLVEFYAPVPEMDDKSVKGPNHELFEKWRNVPAELMDERMRADSAVDIAVSEARYGAAFDAALRRMGYADRTAAEAAWKRVVALAESVTSDQSDIGPMRTPTVQMDGSDSSQSDSPARSIMARPEPRTSLAPLSDSKADFQVEDSADSDGLIDYRNKRLGGDGQSETLLSGRVRGADNTGDFFDMLGVGTQADAFAHSLPPATRAKPDAVKLAAKKAIPSLKKPALDAMAQRAARIEGELNLWGELPPAPVDSGENRLSDSAGLGKGNGDENVRPAARARNPDGGSVRRVGARSDVADDLGSLPLFESGDATGVAGQGGNDPAAEPRGEGDGAGSRVDAAGRALRDGAGVSGGGVSDTLPGRVGDGAGSALDGGRGASGVVSGPADVYAGGAAGDFRTGAAAELAAADLNTRRAVRRAAYDKLPPELRNYRIEGEQVAPRGQKAKLDANLAALRLLAVLETENRAATPEEKHVLARFVGWGGLPQVFDEQKGAAVERGDIEVLADTVERLERQARFAGPAAAEYYQNHLKSERERLTSLQNWQRQYADAYRELKELLPAEDWERAMRSTLNAHYTSPTVIRAMWAALEHMGFKGGRVLEPAGGVGHFFGAMPEDMMKGSELSGVELDSITGRIFAKLYPRANVQVTGFQDAKIPPASQDLVISNVPFAKTGPFDPAFANAPRFNLHNYFFAKALEKVRPGGVVAFITTHNTMDASALQRAWLAQRAEFIGAMRLPKTAFKENASTEVVTDVIFLRKPDGRPLRFVPESWSDTREVGREEVNGVETPIVINEYYARHPEMVLGRNALSGSMYRDGEYTVEPTGDLAAQLADAVKRLPEGMLTGQGSDSVSDPETIFADAKRRNRNFVEQDGKLYHVDGAELRPLDTLPGFEPVTGEGTKAKGARTKREKLLRRLRAWLPLRDHYRAHLALMLNPSAAESAIEESRARLNMLYDQARAVDDGKYPLSHERWNPLRHDPDFFLTLGLEVPNPKETGQPQTYRKADVFSRRTVVPVAAPARAGNVSEALRISQAWKGRVDSEYIADLLGLPLDETEKRLIDDGHVFRDPETGLLEDREGYLSGYVRAKLAAAKIAADADPSYRANVAALEEVQPPPVSLRDITVRLGVSWVPSEVVSKFVQDELRIGAEAVVSRVGESVRWTVGEQRRGAANSEANTRTWSAGGWSGLELLDAVLNGRGIQSFKTEGEGKEKRRVIDPVATAQAQNMAEKIRSRFTDWVRTPGREIEVRVGEFRQRRPVQEIVERGYNDHFNGWRERVWDGSHLTLPGTAPHVMGPENKGGLRAHQKAAIWRAVSEGHAFLAHAPGFGKTNVFIAIAMEWRRLGVAKKPMIVVQNSTLEQFAASFRRMYPAANVLVATKDDLSKDNRKAFTARIAASDWDAVIVAHSQFGLMPSSPETERQQLRVLRDEMRSAMNARVGDLEAGGNGSKEIERDASVKDMAKQLEAIEARLDAVANRKQDDIVNFDEMGIDALLIDEAHYFKKVPFATQLERIAGLDRSSSQRAFDTLVKARGIQSKRDGRGVVLGTGTPITNTLAEVWNMLRLSAPKILERFGVQAFDDFIKSFGSVEKSVEMNAVGKFVERQRLKRFVNGAGLAQFVRAGMDVQMDASKVTLNRPKVDVAPVVVPRSDQVGDYIRELVRIYEKWAALDGKEKQEWSAVPVVLAGLGKAASLDYQLVNPAAADDPGSKVNGMVPLVVRYYREQGERKGTQLIFADSYRSVSTNYIDSFDGGLSANIESDDGSGDENTDDDGDEVKTPAVKEERNLYHKIKDKLVAAGIPPEEVAVVTDFNTGAQREALFAKVNSGEIRVLIGSTWKMGVGVNVQERLYAVHHLDAPWTPADLDQRNARSERDGNRYYDWDIPIKRHSYAMADTLDAGRFQLLETKGKFSRQAMEGKLGVEFDDPAGGIVDEAAQMKALAAGNPLVLKQVELTNQVRELEIGRQAWLRTQEEHAERLANARQKAAEDSGHADKLAQTYAELERITEANPIADAAQLASEIDDRIKAGGKMIEADGAFGLDGPGREVFARDVRGLRLSVTVRGVVDEVVDNGERKQRMSWRATALLHHGQNALRSAEVKTGGGKRALQLVDDALSDARRASEQMAQRAEVDRQRVSDIEREAGGAWELQAEFERAQRALAAVDAAVRENKTELPPEQAALLAAPGQVLAEVPKARGRGVAPSGPVNRAALVRDNLDLAKSIARNWRIKGTPREDVEAEARVGLVKAARRYEPEKGGFRSYAGEAVRNHLRNRYNKAGRSVPTLSTETPESDSRTIGDTLSTPETTRRAADLADSRELLDRVVDSLPERPRRIVRLYMEGLNLERIAAREGVTQQAVGKTFGNSLRVIRQRLRAEGVEGIDDGVLMAALGRETEGDDDAAPGSPVRPGPRPPRDGGDGGTLDSSLGQDEDAVEIRRLLDELASDAPLSQAAANLARVEAEPAGARTIGRPDLANPAAPGDARLVVDAVDAARAAEAERETQAGWAEEARRLVERDRPGVLRDLLERSRRGDVLADPVMVKAAQILVAELTAEAVRTRDPQTMRDAQTLAYAYREQGTEQARAMAARHDPHLTPAQRYKEFLAGALFAPTPTIRKAMRDAWSPAEKSRAVADLRRRLAEAERKVANAPTATRAKVEAEAARLRVELGRALQRKDAVETMNAALSERLAKVEAEIGKMGVTLDDIFNGEAYLRLRGAKIIGAVADKAGFKEAQRRALKLIQNGWSNAEVAKRTGLTPEQVAGVEAELVAKLKERLRTLGDAALDVAKFDTDALFAAPGEGAQTLSAAEREKRIEEIVRAMGFNRTTEREARTKRARKRRAKPEGRAAERTPSSLPPASDAVLDEVRRTRARGSQTETSDPVPRVPPGAQAPATGGPAGALENDAVNARRVPGPAPAYPGDATGRADTNGGNRQMVLGEDADMAPPAFDISDPVQVAQVARVIQATDSNAFDMAFEFWVNSVLSGPLTQGANILGNTANALWDFGPKRFGEAALNAALGNRPDLPQMREYGAMMRAVGPALSRAWANASRAWLGEASFFEADVLDSQISLDLDDKRGGVRTAIGGKLGRAVRIPGRLLMAADDFFKSAVGHLEATAQAYRLGKAEGLSGDRLESRIAGLVNTPGSPAWVAAVEKAKELTFTSENKGNAIGAVTQGMTRLREIDIGGGIRPLRFVLPFVRTPVNIFHQGIRQSPVGSAALALRLGLAGFYRWKDGRPILASYPAGRLAKHVVEQAIAWTVAGMVYAAAAGDDDDEEKPFLITGAVKGDTAGLRELNQRLGLRPYSLRLGSVTVSYGRIEPLATALGATVDLISSHKRRGEAGFHFYDALVGGIADQMEEKTFLRGVGDIVAASRNRHGERESYAANFLASWVPNLVRQPLRQLDPYVRETRGAGFLQSVAGRAIPQSLPTRIDAWGREVEKGGLAAWRATIPVEVLSAPEVARIDRLLQNHAQRNPAKAWAPDPVGRKVTVGGKERELTMEERQKLAVESGRLAARLLAAAPLNIDKPGQDDIDRVRRAFTVARANAKGRLFGN